MIQYLKVIALLCCTFYVLPSQAISLETCKQLAHDNYPAIKQYDLIGLSRNYTLENAQKAWLPQLSASLNGIVFTDILDVSPQMEQMGIDMKNYMAAGSVMINQNIFDGGQINAQKKVASAQADVQKHQLDVTLYELNQRIEQLYFGILMLDEQMNQTRLLQDDLGVSQKTIESMLKGGIANQSDLDAIKVEQLKAQQAFNAQEASRGAYLKMLGIFIGKSLEHEKLEVPSAVVSSTGNNRPELQYFNAQNNLLDAQRKQLDSRLLPTIKAFGMGVYHTKITDMMKNGLLAGGLTLSWNIGALYTRKNDISKLDIQKLQIESSKETFLFNNALQNETSNGNIHVLKKQIEQDEEIVRLRESIRTKSEKKVQLGTESVNELLRDINAVSQARQQKALHELKLLQEHYKLNTNQGF